MDRKKIREFVRQAHPKRRILTSDGTEPAVTASSDDRDVDAGNLRVSQWKKFVKPESPSKGRRHVPQSTDAAGSDLREKFRPRTLTGGAPGSGAPVNSRARTTREPASRTARQGSGKIALERVELAPNGASGDSTQDSLDLLVDEDHGIIGESDSGPEKK